jgi:glycosyltransferase involved in cell wall biosynthesis
MGEDFMEIIPLEKPLVSVIIAVFNGEKTLQQCIDSIVNQNTIGLEIIVVDGGSTDGTLQILKSNNSSIGYWVSEPDRGVYHAWNKALIKARGEWICFLGADDYFWNENVLARLTPLLCQTPLNVDLVYGQVMLLTTAGKPIYPIGQALDDTGAQLAQMMCIPHPGSMHRRSFFEKHGVFDEAYRIAGDYEMFLRAFVGNESEALFIPDFVTVGMRHGGLSSNPHNSLIALREMRNAQKKHGVGLPSRSWILAIIRVYARLFVWRVLGERNGKWIIDVARRMMGLPAYWSKV